MAEWVRFAPASAGVKMGKGKHVFFVKTVHSRANSCIGGGGAAEVRCVGAEDEDGMFGRGGCGHLSPCWLRALAFTALKRYVSIVFGFVKPNVGRDDN